MRKPIVDIYQGEEVDLVDDYAPGFREAEEEGNGLAIGFDLRGILANDGSPLRITDHERYQMLVSRDRVNQKLC